MPVNIGTSGYLRAPILEKDEKGKPTGTISRDFVKYLQNLETHISQLTSLKVVQLPANPGEGSIAFAANGRKQGEGAGAGTGVPAYYSNGLWRRYSDDTQVVA
jgi:hypothetical protein